MTPEEMAAYVGKPYRLGGDGPDDYDCRGLVCAVLRRHFGRDMPALPSGQDMASLWSKNLAEAVWETVTEPTHGDAVVLRGGADPHVGVYLVAGAPGVLHAFSAAGQVVWTPFDRLRSLGFSRLSFVRCHASVAESGASNGELSNDEEAAFTPGAVSAGERLHNRDT